MTQAEKDHHQLTTYKLLYLCMELASDSSCEDIIQEMEERVRQKYLR